MDPTHGVMSETDYTKVDVFAFGMLVVEVFNGKVPFYALTEVQAKERILKGDRPWTPRVIKDPEFTKGMEELLKRCWLDEPDKRPTMERVVEEWRAIGGAPITAADIATFVMT